MQILRFPFQDFEVLPTEAELAELKKLESPLLQGNVSVTDEPPAEGFTDLPVAVRYSEEEVQAREAAAEIAGREAGFAEGLAQGQGEHAKREEQLLEVLQQASVAMATIQNMYTESLTEMKQAVLTLSGQIAMKLAGKAMRERPDEAISAMVESLIPQLIQQPEIKIYVHPDVADSLQEKIISLSSRLGFAGRVDVVASADLERGDCRVEWPKGDAEMNQAALQQKLDEILNAYR